MTPEPDGTPDGPRTGKVVFGLLVAFVLVNLPLGHHLWEQWRLGRDGQDVVAAVTATDVVKEQSDPHYVVRFRLPDAIDPAQRDWPADVTRAAYDQAESSGEITVRVLPDRPGTQEVAGARASALGLIVIGAVDGVLVLIAGLLCWHGRRRPDEDPPATLQV